MKPEEVKQLKSLLPRGSRSLIQKATKYSYVYITAVLNGDRYNQVVIDSAMIIAEESQKAKKSAITKLRDLMDQAV